MSRLTVHHMFQVHAGLFECFHYPPNSDADCRIFNMQMCSFLMCIHAENLSLESHPKDFLQNSSEKRPVSMSVRRYSASSGALTDLEANSQKGQGWADCLGCTGLSAERVKIMIIMGT